MSVSIRYKGNAGNHMFQYFTALIYCDKHSLTLNTKPSPKMLGVLHIKHPSPHVQDGHSVQKSRNITSTDYDDRNDIRYYGKCHYNFIDYFQNAVYLNQNYDIITKYVSVIPFKCDLNVPINPSKDILYILRLGDFIHQHNDSEIVHPKYLLDIMDDNKYERAFFLFHPMNDKYISQYLDYFKNTNYVILDNGMCKRCEMFDFNIINMFQNIAMTNSTFNWWSAYFCKEIENKNIYTPKYLGYKGIGKYFKKHGNHVIDLENIRDVSKVYNNDFIDFR